MELKNLRKKEAYHVVNRNKLCSVRICCDRQHALISIEALGLGSGEGMLHVVAQLSQKAKHPK